MRQIKNIFSLLFFSILITGCATTVQKRIMVTEKLSSKEKKQLTSLAKVVMGDPQMQKYLKSYQELIIK